MYAIVDIAGQQFKVKKDQEILVHRLEEKEGAMVYFTDVLLLEDHGKFSIGTPFVKDISVSAKILSHEKGPKINVFKKKRRKGYQKENKHRQLFSKIQIENIGKITPLKTEAKKVEEPKKEIATEKTSVTIKSSSEKEVVVKKVSPKKTTEIEKTLPTQKTATVKTSTPKKETTPKKSTTKKSTEVKKETAATKKTTSTKKAAPKKTKNIE